MNIVIFTGGGFPPPETAELFFKNIDFNYVIAADSGLETLDVYVSRLGESFYPDMILGDMDSLKNASLLEKYSKCKQKTFPSDKDYTDTELAFFHARNISKEHNSKNTLLILVGGSGGSCDHFIALYDSFSTGIHADFWLCENQYIAFLPEGKTALIHNLNKTDKVSVARLTKEFSTSVIEAKGLRWNNLKESGMASISNRISDEYFEEKKPVELKAAKGSFLVFLPYQSKIDL